MQRDLTKGSGSVNDITVAAIVSLSTKKLINKQIPPRSREGNAENSSYPSFIITIFAPETEEQMKTQVLDQNTFYMSDFELKSFRLVGFG